ncbi:MAG: acyl-CoA dehydrogenase family protein [Candidatus Tectimicrobiota bacterium]
MDFELIPSTQAGRKLVALAEAHAADFATRAPQHDREGSFPFENIAAMQRSGVMAACVPSALGGLGVDSIHDYVLAINRLGRGDGSSALLANMHNFRTWFMTRTWEAARAAGDTLQADRTAQFLRQVGSGQAIICALASESGTDLLHPLVEARRTAHGWVLNGRKIFATISPVATLLGVLCRFKNAQGQWHQALASVPADTPGVHIEGNWDALGMRATGSHDVVFTDCVLPEAALVDGGPWGTFTERFLAANSVAVLGLSAAFLGIAEAARQEVLTRVSSQHQRSQSQPLATRPLLQQTVAEIEIDLMAARAALERSALTAEAFFRDYPVGSSALQTLHFLMKDLQCMKWFVTRKAIDIVDKALTVWGGASYLTSSLLARLYRDVRAGPFMQPFAPHEAFAYIGKVTLGLDPTSETV